MNVREILEGQRCWKGYEKKGTKIMFGKRVNNCVKKEDVDFCVNCGELVLSETLNEDLKKWFKQKWVRFGPKGKIRGACGGKSKGEGKPKCFQPRRPTHWARRVARVRHAGRGSRIPIRTDVVKPRTWPPRKNSLHTPQSII